MGQGSGKGFHPAPRQNTVCGCFSAKSFILLPYAENLSSGLWAIDCLIEGDSRATFVWRRLLRAVSVSTAEKRIGMISESGGGVPHMLSRKAPEQMILWCLEAHSIGRYSVLRKAHLAHPFCFYPK